MAITPHEAGKVTEDEIKTVDVAEKKLDKILCKDFPGTDQVRVTIPLSALNVRCREELLRRFRASGWVIQTKYDEGSDHPLVRNSDAHPYWIFSAGSKVVEGRYGFPEVVPAPPSWRDDGPINSNWR